MGKIMPRFKFRNAFARHRRNLARKRFKVQFFGSRHRARRLKRRGGIGTGIGF